MVYLWYAVAKDLLKDLVGCVAGRQLNRYVGHGIQDSSRYLSRLKVQPNPDLDLDTIIKQTLNKPKPPVGIG